jgi:hypothetical protein
LEYGLARRVGFVIFDILSPIGLWTKEERCLSAGR